MQGTETTVQTPQLQSRPLTGSQESTGGKHPIMSRRVPVFDTPPLFLLNAVLWVVVVFFGHYSHQQAWSTVTQKQMFYVCQDATIDPRRRRRRKEEKALHIYIEEFWGDFFLAVLTVFIQECLTAQFFSWHDKWFIDTILGLKTCVCVYKCIS